jgi:hypothetical protein
VDWKLESPGHQIFSAKKVHKGVLKTPLKFTASSSNKTATQSASHNFRLARKGLLKSDRLGSDGMRRPVSAGCDTLPMFDVLEAQ